MGVGPGKGAAWVTNSMRLSVPANSTTGSGPSPRDARYGWVAETARSQDQGDAPHVLVGLGAILALPPGLDGHVEPAEGDGQQCADDGQRDQQLDQREAATVTHADHRRAASFSSASDTVRSVLTPTARLPSPHATCTLIS